MTVHAPSTRAGLSGARRARPPRTGFKLIDGFTLIEIMLAIVILGIILVMLAGSFHAVAGSKVHGENRLAVDQAARTILFQMADELRGAVQTQPVPSHTIFEGQGGMQAGLPLDSITFSTLDPGHRRALEDFGPEDLIAYTTAPTPNHRGWFTLMRSQQSALLTQAAGNQAVILCNNLISLHLRYFNGQSWSESWDSNSQPPLRALPQEVAIDLTLATPGGVPFTVSTAIAVPMAFNQW